MYVLVSLHRHYFCLHKATQSCLTYFDQVGRSYRAKRHQNHEDEDDEKAPLSGQENYRSSTPLQTGVAFVPKPAQSRKSQPKKKALRTHPTGFVSNVDPESFIICLSGQLRTNAARAVQKFL